jgi:hypothetical protein
MGTQKLMKKLIHRTPAKSVATAPRRRMWDSICSRHRRPCGVANRGTARDLLSKSGKCRAALVRPIITLGLGVLLALFSAAVTYSAPSTMDEAFGGGAAALFLPPTSTPQPQDASEIGSTDGIVMMGILIALIIVVPILLQRKSWMENR